MALLTLIKLFPWHVDDLRWYDLIPFFEKAFEAKKLSVNLAALSALAVLNLRIVVYLEGVRIWD